MPRGKAGRFVLTAMERFNFEGHAVRVELDDDGQPWWVLADVCGALGLTSPHKVADRIAEDDRNSIPITDALGRQQSVTVVNEPGLYAVIFRSNKTEAERFRLWVFRDVLPAIRKTGSYTHRAAEPKRTPIEVETRYPDGRVVVERFAITQQPHTVEVEQLPAPTVDIDEVRRRFNDALNRQLGRADWYLALDARGRGEYRAELNGKMKTIIGRGRDQWTAQDYETAAHWLRMHEDIDVRWAVASKEAS